MNDPFINKIESKESSKSADSHLISNDSADEYGLQKRKRIADEE